MTEPREKTQPRILCAGGAVQDIVMRVDNFPDAGTKVQAVATWEARIGR